MKNPSIRPKSKGFTLVELLVVIAIIAGLAAFAYPAIMGALRDGKITESEKMATDIIASIDSFEGKYDYLPYESGAGSAPDVDTAIVTDNDKLLLVLLGQEDTINTNGIQFFDADTAKSKRNGIIYDGDTPKSVVDSFGNPFTLVIDYDYDDKINVTLDLNEVYKTKDGEDLIIRSKRTVIATEGADNEWNDIHDVKSF